MAETRRKRGLEYQNWCKKWIEEEFAGCVVHNQPLNHFRLPNGIWASKSNDILGCVDILAIIPDRKPLFIQCTLDTHIDKRLAEFSRIPWDLSFCNVQLWQKKKDGSTLVRILVKNKDTGAFSFVEVAHIVRRKLCLNPEIVATIIRGLGDGGTQQPTKKS